MSCDQCEALLQRLMVILMRTKVYLLEEYVGDFDKGSESRNVVGIYRKKKQALAAKEEHFADIDPDCIDGYCLTELTVLRKGFQFCYMTEDLGK